MGVGYPLPHNTGGPKNALTAKVKPLPKTGVINPGEYFKDTIRPDHNQLGTGLPPAGYPTCFATFADIDNLYNCLDIDIECYFHPSVGYFVPDLCILVLDQTLPNRPAYSGKRGIQNGPTSASDYTLQIPSLLRRDYIASIQKTAPTGDLANQFPALFPFASSVAPVTSLFKYRGTQTFNWARVAYWMVNNQSIWSGSGLPSLYAPRFYFRIWYDPEIRRLET